MVMMRNCASSPLRHANPYKWRRSAAIQYLRGGGRIATPEAIPGHATLDMTPHHARIAGVDRTDAHAVADPARRPKTRVWCYRGVAPGLAGDEGERHDGSPRATYSGGGMGAWA